MMIQRKTIGLEDLIFYCWADDWSLRTSQSDALYICCKCLLASEALADDCHHDWRDKGLGAVSLPGISHIVLQILTKSSVFCVFYFMTSRWISDKLQLRWGLWILCPHHFLFRTRRWVGITLQSSRNMVWLTTTQLKLSVVKIIIWFNFLCVK